MAATFPDPFQAMSLLTSRELSSSRAGAKRAEDKVTGLYIVREKGVWDDGNAFVSWIGQSCT